MTTDCNTWYFILCLPKCGSSCDLRMLRQEYGCPTGRAIRNLVLLDAVSVRDKMATESPAQASSVKLSVPEDISKSHDILMYTVVPDQNRKTNDNNKNTLKNPVDVCTDKIDPSTIYVVDVGKKVLLKVRLHYPATVTEIGSNYAHQEFVTNMKGVVFVSDTARKDIFVKDVHGLLYLNCKNMDKASLEKVVCDLKIKVKPTGAKGSSLKEDLKKAVEAHFKQRQPDVLKKPAVNTNSCGRSVNGILKCTAPSALLSHSDLLFVVDAEEHVIKQYRIDWPLGLLECQVLNTYAVSAHSDVKSLCLTTNTILFADRSTDGGLFVTNLQTGNTQKILRNNSKECKTVGGVTVNKEGTIIFSDLENGTLNSTNNEGMNVRKLLGTSEKKAKDGHSGNASLLTPGNICCQGNSIIITSKGRVSLTSSITALCWFLQIPRLLLQAFNVHTKIKGDEKTENVEGAIQLIKKCTNLLKEQENYVRGDLEILHTLNGPEGTPAAQTRNSVDIILSGLKRLQDCIKSADESLQSNFGTLHCHNFT